MSKTLTNGCLGRQRSEIAPTRRGVHGGEPAGAVDTTIDSHQRAESRVENLIERLPNRLKAATRWLRQPSSRWARIPAGILLMLGGLFSILPLLGIWMLPLGLLLLAEDLTALRRLRDYTLDKLERRRPDWFAVKTGETQAKTAPPSQSS